MNHFVSAETTPTSVTRRDVVEISKFGKECDWEVGDGKEVS